MGILPPGFRFHPTDVELIMYYLKRKVMGKKFQFEAVAELNIYKYAPWDLADKSLLRRDLEWYFFSPREKKYGSGGRTNRATETGYWKTTGKDRPVSYNDRNVGMIKTLIFYKGHAPKGERTDWVMHEYRIEDKNLADIGIIQDSYALCKIFQKSGLGPKNGAQYGAPFREEEWDELESVGLQGDSPFTVNLQPSSYINSTAMSSAVATTSGSWPMSKEIQCPARPFAIDMPCSIAGPSGIVSGLPMSMCTDVVMRPIENYTTENAIVSFESCQRTATGPKTDATFCEEELNDVEEVSAISSPVNGQVLSVHLPCRELYDSAELSSILPGTSSTWSLSEPGPSTPSTVVTNLPSYGANLPEDDIPALLSMFSESSSMLLTENNNDEHLSTVHIDKSVEAHSCGEKNAVNGPGDSYNFGKQGDPGFDFSNTWDTSKRMLLEDDMVFVELKDLDTPLNHRADDSESLWAQVDSQYAPYTCFQDLDGSYYESNLQNNVQDVPRLILPFFPPESPRWMDDILEVSGKGLDTQNLEGYGPDTCMGYEIPFQISCRQPDESSNSDQIQRRGSIHHFP